MYPVDYVGIIRGFNNSGLLKHYGLDLGWSSNHGGKNVPVKAIWGGTVIYVQYQKTGGYVVVIKHTTGVFKGYCSEYAHLLKGSIKYKVGDTVKMGDVIAKMGASGKVTGTHLHIAIYKGTSIPYKGDYKKNYINPVLILELYKEQEVNKNTAKAYKIKIHQEIRTHKIQSGETLSSIAKKYNTTWQKLYAKNKSIIGSDPNKIKVGMVIEI